MPVGHLHGKLGAPQRLLALVDKLYQGLVAVRIVFSANRKQLPPLIRGFKILNGIVLLSVRCNIVIMMIVIITISTNIHIKILNQVTIE